MNTIDCLKNGSRLISISRVCDLIKLDFSTEDGTVCLHVQSALMRGLQKEQLLISSTDIFFPSKNYKKKLFKKFKWDLPGNTLFDDQLHDFKNRILDKAIFSVQMFGKDLILTFDENYKIEILACTLEQEREYFRIFKKGDLNSHIVVES